MAKAVSFGIDEERPWGGKPAARMLDTSAWMLDTSGSPTAGTGSCGAARMLDTSVAADVVSSPFASRGCFGDMENSQQYLSSLPSIGPPLVFLDCCLRGVSQVVFQNSPVSGVFILVALFVFDWRTASYGILANIAATAAAVSFHRRSYKGYESYTHGIYGFNGTLVGLGIATFTTFDVFSDDPQRVAHSAAAVALFGVVSTVVTNALAKRMRPQPCLTLPFNISIIWFLGGILAYTRWDKSASVKPHLPVGREDIQTCFRSEADEECLDPFVGFMVATLRGVSQVFFASSSISGAIMLVGIAVCSPLAAALAAVGSSLGLVTGLMLGVDGSNLYFGLYGYNSVLTAMAIGGGPFGTKTLSTFFWGCVGAVITAFLNGTLASILAPVGLPVFTLPFCLATLPLLEAGLHGKDEDD